MKRSYGHTRVRQVPALDGTQPKVCGKCSLWFAARPRERTCDGCVPQETRNARFALDPHWGTKAGLKAPGTAGQRGRKTRSQDPGRVTESALLGIGFTRPVKVCYALALEAAACLDGKRPAKAWRTDPLSPRVTSKPVTDLDPALVTAHRYAVSQGLQGCGGCRYCEAANA